MTGDFNRDNGVPFTNAGSAGTDNAFATTATPKPSEPLKFGAVENDFETASGSDGDSGLGGTVREVASAPVQAVKQETGKYSQQATDKLRAYADDGKARATGALDDLARMIHDAADTVDEKVGAQYGQYARSAADAVTGFADSLRDKDVDDLVGDARDIVRKSPGVAIGAAATIGFVVARIAKAGFDAAQTPKADDVDVDFTPDPKIV